MRTIGLHPHRVCASVRRSALLVAFALPSCAVEPTVDPSLYVASGFTDQVFQLDAASGAVVETFSLDVRRAETDEPHALERDPRGRFWYVSLAHGDPTLWKYEVGSNRLVGRVALGTAGAGRIGITPDGTRAFIPDYYRSGGALRSEVAVVRLETLDVIERLTICVAPHDAKVDPSGALVAIACSKSDEIVVLDVATLQERNRFFVAADPGDPGFPRYRPLNLVWSPAGDRLYVALQKTSEVRAFTREGALRDQVSVGAGPAQLAISRDGRMLATANRGDGSLSIVELPELAERARVPLGVAHPHGITLAPDGRRAFVTYEGDTSTPGGVVAVDVTQREVVWETVAGAFTLGIIYVP
ncbi:MAG: lactonase family protein [Gemmatimonadota bacterium]|nr:lactonase family protein [Gemmatimonadota bacterium]